MIDVEKEERKRNALIALRKDFDGSKNAMDFFFQSLGDESWRVRKEAIELAVCHPTEEIIQILIKGLESDENAGLRNASQEALTRIGSPAISFLQKRFYQADEDVRKFILDILGDINCKEVCNFLIEALKDPAENVVIAACENLGKIKCESAIPSLLLLLDPKKQWLSFVIIESLAQIGVPFDAENILPLFHISQFRKPVLDLLPLINPPHNVEILKNAFSDNSNYIKINAAKKLFDLIEKNIITLSDIKPYLKETITYSPIYEKLLEPSSKEDKIFALLAYISEDENFFKNLIEKGCDEALEFFGSLINHAPFHKKSIILSFLDRYEGKRQAYLAYLCGIFHIEEALPRLFSLCNSSFGHTRQAVAFSLGRFFNNEAIGCLFNLINDPFLDVREQAVNSLAVLINSDSFPHGISEKIFQKGEKEAILSLLDLLYKTNAINNDYLARALKSPFPEVREKAINLIGILKKKDLLTELVFYLTDENESVRLSVIEALGKIGDERFVETLAEFISSDDFQFKKAAIESIYSISPESLKKYEADIFKDLTPFTFFGLLTLIEKGIPLSTELFIKKAFEFDDRDIFLELISFFNSLNLKKDLERLITSIIARKGEDYLQPFLKKQENDRKEV